MDQSAGGRRLGSGEEAGNAARPRRKTIGVTPITRAGGKQVYRLAFSYLGAQCRETIALPHTKANAAYCERLRAEILGQIERGTFDYVASFPNSDRARRVTGARVVPTMRTLLEAYRDRVKRTFAPSTFEGTGRSINNVLIPWCGDKLVTQLKPSDIRDFVATKPVKLKTINNLLLPLRAVLDEAVADGVIEFNPMTRLKFARLVPDDKRRSDYNPQPYAEQEIITLLGNIALPERFAFQLHAYAGLRTGELIGLRWHRVDLEAGVITIQETTTSGEDKPTPKTPAGVRTVPLLPAAREALELLRPYTQLAGGRVTVNPKRVGSRKPEAWDDKRLQLIWKNAHKGTGIAYRNPYQLRHSFASNLLSQGENAALISRLLGHKNVHMVIQHYGRWIEQGEALGFDRPPRTYGMRRLWAQEKAA